MKFKLKTLVLALVIMGMVVGFSANPLHAQGPQGRSFGFGIVLGDPLGGTIKYWTASNEALAASIGGDYFGSPRLDVDYYWHFNAFNSSIVKLYAGPGLAIGFGSGRDYLWYKRGHDYFFYRQEGQTGFGARVLVGLDIIPRRTPIELYLEVGPLIGFAPAFGASFDAAIGIRFYP
ncbi:MAG: hypothetical protein Q8916_00510 [Bacteroidota bacterium]|nr:hypothetical protein [Bacteroidota bacterium]MDP4228868.1 hypothetical protein [Bacteroidota bacterium]MDP4234936.1 hypothetical protein [Bacteroidota bacterium]